ncbi:MAG: AraC family transcriptional regulator [Vallitalea sp.]|jgi:AraC-like DNA-binding protein|nr:AraC family transcriptional regulator [Vallitalea sp.]
MSKSNTNSKIIYEKMEQLINTMLHTYYIRIDACNDFILPKEWDFKNRVNPNFHMAFVREGKGSYIYGDNQNDEMLKGKLYFFTSGYCHSRLLNKSELPHLFLLRFSILHKDTHKEIYVKIPFGFSFQTNKSLYITLLTKLIYNYHNTERKYSRNIASTILEQILFELINDIDCKLNKKPTDSRLRKTTTYIHNNIEKNIPLDELCQLAGLSKNYYRKLFKDHYGMHPKSYIINARLEKAEHYLMETEYSIKYISGLLGYSDQYSFSKQFKEKKGYAPTKFRNNQL